MGLLATVRSARSSYGIRHQDYERYRQYCSRKLARARSTKQNKDPRILEIFLFEAERAWAYAMQLRKEPNPRAQFHLIKRLRKAVKSSRLLQSQAQELQLDFKEQLEISAYSILMLAYLYFEQQKWQEALDNFLNAKTIYEKSAIAIPELHHVTLCEAAIDEINPSIKYCAYNLQMVSGEKIDIAEILELRENSSHMGLEFLDSEIRAFLDKQVPQLQDSKVISWCGQQVSLKNSIYESFVLYEALWQKFVRQFGTFFANPTSPQVLEALDKILGVLWDSTALIENELKEHEKATRVVKSLNSDSAAENLNFTHAYIVYHRTIASTHHHLFSLYGNEKHVENVKLCDVMLRDLESLLELAFLKTQNSLIESIRALCEFIKVCRVYSMGRLHLSQNKSPQALIVFDHAKDLYGNLESVDLIMPAQFEKLGQDIDIFRAVAIANQVPTISTFEPIPVKPVFYDLALAEIELPRKELEERFGAKKGLFSFFQ